MRVIKTNQSHATKSSVVIASSSGNELPIIQQGENLLYDARLLHKNLKSKRQFADWAKDKIVNSLFKEGVDYFSQKSEKLGAGRKAIDYHLTLDMAKHIAMLENNEVGYAVRNVFIQKEKEARGITHLPVEKQLLKGLKPQRISDKLMYPYTEVLERCGYSTRSSSSSRKAKYWMHFVKFGNKLYITEEFALQLYKQRQVISNRAALVAMQPVLPLSFYNLEKGGAQ